MNRSLIVYSHSLLVENLILSVLIQDFDNTNYIFIINLNASNIIL